MAILPSASSVDGKRKEEKKCQTKSNEGNKRSLTAVRRGHTSPMPQTIGEKNRDTAARSSRARRREGKRGCGKRFDVHSSYSRWYSRYFVSLWPVGLERNTPSCTVRKDLYMYVGSYRAIRREAKQGYRLSKQQQQQEQQQLDLAYGNAEQNRTEQNTTGLWYG